MEPDLAPVDVERRYRAIFVGLVVLVLGVCAAWWLTSNDRASAPGRESTEVAAVASSGPTSFAEVDPPPAFEEAGSRVPVAGDEIQLCGGHWVEAGPDGRPLPKAVLAVSLTELEDIANSVRARMTASSSPRVQAAAHYYRAGNVGALPPASRDRDAEAAFHRDALVRLAQTTDDSRIYGWAWRYCNVVSKLVAPGEQGGCTQISAAQWARMDPENAEPWLAVAEEARGRNEPAAFDDAMFHVAVATRHQSDWRSLAATVADFVPQDERSLLGTYMTIVQAVVVDAVGDPLWRGVADYCGANAIAEPNRRETCERAATMLVDRSTTAMARSAGVEIGRRLGWNAARLDAVSEREDVEMAAERLSGGYEEPDLVNCAPMVAMIERVRAVAEVGQLEVARRQVSSFPVAQLAAEMRRERERQSRLVATEPAASAASVAVLPSGESVAQR